MLVYTMFILAVLGLIFLFFFGWICCINARYKRKLKKDITYASILKSLAQSEKTVFEIETQEDLSKYPKVKRYLNQATYLLDNHFEEYKNIHFANSSKSNDAEFFSEINKLKLHSDNNKTYDVLLNVEKDIGLIYKLKHPYKHLFTSIKKNIEMQILKLLVNILILIAKVSIKIDGSSSILEKKKKYEEDICEKDFSRADVLIKQN